MILALSKAAHEYLGITVAALGFITGLILLITAPEFLSEAFKRGNRVWLLLLLLWIICLWIAGMWLYVTTPS